MRSASESSETLSEWHKRLLSLFDKQIAPTFKQQLTFPEGSKKLKGRTYVVYDKEGKMCDAYKFLRKGENPHKLGQEFLIARSILEDEHLRPNLVSELVEPVELLFLKELPPEVAKENSPLIDPKCPVVYHYRAGKNIFKYIQNIDSEKPFRTARKAYLHDNTKMIRLGIFPEDPLHHNIDQKRVYMPVIDLTGIRTITRGGSGRIDQYTKNRHPNARESGSMVDLRDAYRLYGKEEEIQSLLKDYPHAEITNYDARIYFLMNGLSLLLVNDLLFQIIRYKRLKRLNWENEIFVKSFAKQLAISWAQVAHAYTKRSFEDCLNFATRCGVDWVLAAKQAAFLSDTSQRGYPSWFANGKVPPGMYGDVPVYVDMSNTKNFDPIKGFTTNGFEDFGPFNGPSGLTEFEKALYMLFIMIAIAEGE